MIKACQRTRLELGKSEMNPGFRPASTQAPFGESAWNTEMLEVPRSQLKEDRQLKMWKITWKLNIMKSRFSRTSTLRSPCNQRERKKWSGPSIIIKAEHRASQKMSLRVMRQKKIFTKVRIDCWFPGTSEKPGRYPRLIVLIRDCWKSQTKSWRPIWAFKGSPCLFRSWINSRLMVHRRFRAAWVLLMPCWLLRVRVGRISNSFKGTRLMLWTWVRTNSWSSHTKESSHRLTKIGPKIAKGQETHSTNQ